MCQNVIKPCNYARQHICYSAYMLSPARLSVIRVYHRKTVEVRIMKSSPYGRPIPLVLWGKFHPKILRGSPRQGALYEGGVSKISDFRTLSRHISETAQDMTKVVIER